MPKILSFLFIFLVVGLSTYFYIFKNIQTENLINVTSKIDENKEDKYNSPISIKYLRDQKIEDTSLKIESFVGSNPSYKQYLVSYSSEGNKIYALLTIPNDKKPDEGFPAIIFNHGYIPPKSYSTTRNYASYVDYLARNGFVVLKIDMRGHGNSEGVASGSYFSNAYTLDVLSALKALKNYEEVDDTNIGLWGHSMSGNLVLRTLLVNSEFKAGVIWAGAVYSYKDFAKYRISDSSYAPFRTTPSDSLISSKNRETSPEVSKIRSNPQDIDFNNDFWKSISLTENINYLNTPIQLHHAINDDVVNVGYSRDLVSILKNNNKEYEYHEYSYGGHNISGSDFTKAMSKTVDFFNKNLKNSQK